MTTSRAARQSAITAIHALQSEWEANFNAGDIERLVNTFYAEDARALPPEGRMITGRAGIREYFRELSKSGPAKVSLGVVSIEATDDLGYLVGTYAFTLHSESGERSHSSGYSLVTYRRGADGAWKCMVDMWHDAPT
jgi:uncharacterized protein (TIGR02246 family)